MLPEDHLRPIWRCYMNGTGVGAIALDPREARWVLKHGCLLDGERYRALLTGWDEIPDAEGRLTVRLEKLA